MSKLIIYLDQNFISEIAKLSLKDKKGRINPKFETLFDLIEKGADQEKFVVPDSWIHQMETPALKNKVLEDLIVSRLKNVGQVSFNTPWEIKDSQFINSLLAFLNKESARGSELWEEAFKENPDKRMENFDITVRMPFLNWNIFSAEGTKTLQDIRNSGVKYLDQYELEIEATRQDYKNKLKDDFKYNLLHYGISEEEAKNYIDSDEFVKIPNLDIFTKLWLKDLSNTGRQGKDSDHNDVEMISAHLPYIDVLATDTYWSSQIKELGLDKNYRCRVFSMKDKELDEFIDLLQEELTNRVSANQSLFSVLCKLPPKKIYSVNFIKRLNLAKNKFLNTGKNWNKEKYVDVFFEHEKNDVRFPKSNFIKKFGSRALNQDQWSELLIFGYNFKRLYNPHYKDVIDLVQDIPNHLRGLGTAIFTEDTKFDIGLREHDSDVMYDIEDAINKRLNNSLKYKIQIVWQKKK